MNIYLNETGDGKTLQKVSYFVSPWNSSETTSADEIVSVFPTLIVASTMIPCKKTVSHHVMAFVLLLTTSGVSPFVSFTSSLRSNVAPVTTSLFSTNTPAEGLTKTSNPPSTEWELDCYSRPVMVGGKKLWEVLLTDSTGSFRYCQTLPSNQVNSKELRRVVEKVIDEREVKPQTIRFFRGAMFNMIQIALSEVEVVAKPSRCTFELASWLEERHRDVYPAMEGCVRLCRNTSLHSIHSELITLLLLQVQGIHA